MKATSRVLASTVLCLLLPAAVSAAAQGVFSSLKSKVREKMTADPYANPPAPAAQPSSPEAASAPAQYTQDTPPVSIAAYQNYDFVPGEVTIFADDFTTTQDGEFPDHWELKAGQAVVNRVSGWEALLLTDGNSALVKPRMKVANYLPTQWTLEFDTYANPAAYPPKLFFYDGDIEGQLTINYSEAGFVCNNTEGVDLLGSYPAALGGDPYKGQWHHIAIAVRGKQLKLYVDQYRVLTVPDMHMQPGNFVLGGIGGSEGPITTSNWRLATGGGMNLVGKKFTDAKIVTHAINFDVDQATIRPESMGALTQIKNLMASDPTLKFEVDGHTDNSGNAPHNQQLSEQRAAAVKSQLATMGIDASRLSTKGFGETKPLGANTTAEGKANNRRVEFVRM